MSVTHVDLKFVKELEDLILAHLDDPKLSIEFLCERMSMSRSQLHRRIKAGSGLSTSHFIRHVRLEASKKLLIESDLNISEIAYSVGLSSPQNFSKYFAENYGVTPSAFRKKSLNRRPITGDDPDIKMPIVGVENSAKIIWGLSRSSMALLGLLMAILLSVVAWNSRDTTLRRSIAIIPFENYSTDEDEFYTEGVVEDILMHLTGFEDLHVIALHSTEEFKGRQNSMKKIGRKLDVNYVLDGSVRHTADQVRISARLINVKTGANIWTKNYQRSNEDVLKIQSEVALEIAKSLNQEISTRHRRLIESIPTQSIDAYNAMLRGRHLLRSRNRTDMEKSIEHFDQALDLDSKFADALTGKANAYNLLSNVYSRLGESDSLLKKAEENALMAIKEDIHNGRAYAILGNIYRDQSRWKEALTSYEIALELHPKDALTNYWKALTLRSMGDLSGAIKFHKIACDLDPLYPVINAGYLYTMTLNRQYREVTEFLDRDSAIFKNSFLHEYVRGYNFMCQTSWEDAIVHFENCHRINPLFTPAEVNIAVCLIKLDQIDEAMSYLRSVQAQEQVDHLIIAKLKRALGHDDQSIAALLTASSNQQFHSDILVDPLYRDILHRPSMIPILRQFGLYESYLATLQ